MKLTRGCEGNRADGVVRAQLIASLDGETPLRMRDAKGEVRVKLGAGEDGSGLILADQSTAPGLHVLAKRGTTTVSLTDADGTRRVIRASDPWPSRSKLPPPNGSYVDRVCGDF